MYRIWFSVALAVGLSAGLSGCGSSSSGDDDGRATQVDDNDLPPTGALVVTGSIKADAAAKGNVTKSQTVTLKNLSGDVVTTVQTDADGKYAMSIQPGSLATSASTASMTTLTAESDNTVATSGSLFILSSATKDADSGKAFGFNRTVKLSTGNVTSMTADTSTIDVGSSSMAEIGAIFGSVTFSDAKVELAGTDVFIPGKSFFVRTGSDGEFNFLFVPPGTYSIRIENGRYFKTQDVTVEAGKTTNVGAISVALLERNPLPLEKVFVGSWVTKANARTGTGSALTVQTGTLVINSSTSATYTGTGLSSVFTPASMSVLQYLTVLNDGAIALYFTTSGVPSVEVHAVTDYTSSQITITASGVIEVLTKQ